MTIPANSLASVDALLSDRAKAQTPGPAADIAIEADDECNTVIDVPGAVRAGLVGVQSNQLNRALDLTSCRCYGGCPSGTEGGGCGCETVNRRPGAPDGRS